ncbi:hypothetical protein ACL02R_28805 [Streptomyces sp. MS19]|uniref:hypothetical protein n=1 Tax=Streptomyces sp. MS19 TaxID=3385972 RepID=UPI00399FA277
MEENGTRPPRDRREPTAALRTGFALIRQAVPGLRYRLVGTAAASVQGVDLPVGDVDVLFARRRDIDAAAEALGHLPCVSPPRGIAVSRQYYACCTVDGIGFGVSTMERDCAEDGWENQGPGPWRHHVTVDRDGPRPDRVRLELRLTTGFLRDRPDRHRPPLAHLRAHGAALGPLRHSLAVRGIPGRHAAG